MRTAAVFFLFLTQFVNGQQPFMKNAGGLKLDRALYITATSDKGYMACGYSSSFGNSLDMYVAKLDSQGNLEWQQNYGGDKMDLGWSVHELSNGWLLHGCTWSSDTTNQDIALLRLDPNGKLIWEKTYGNKKDERTTDLLVLSDGNYLLIGERILQDSVNRDSYILKIDTAGNIIWERTFGGPKIERTYYGAETGEGDYLVSGSIFPYDNKKADLLFLKISKDGDLAWSKTLGERNRHEVAHSFRRDRDGKTYTVNGYIESTQSGIHNAYFLQVDGEARVINSYEHSTGNDTRMMHAEQTSDNGFIVTGFTRSDITSNNWDAVLLRYDSKGTVQWMKTFGTPEKDDQGYWVVCDPGGGYTLTGYTYSHGTGGDLWVIRTNARGELE
jgi:hypothetical protein